MGGFKLAGLLLLAVPFAARAQAPCENTPAYSTCEIVFELAEKDAAAHPKPYSTVASKCSIISRHHGATARLGRGAYAKIGACANSPMFRRMVKKSVAALYSSRCDPGSTQIANVIGGVITM